MITLQADLFEDLNDPARLREALQTAIALEHATIPVYLYAWYSLRIGKNAQIRGLIKSVVLDEMAHFALACNLLNAIGGTPVVNTPDFVPNYPCPLPGAINSGFHVRLAPFSRELVHDVFMEIEEPEKPLDFDERASFADVPKAAPQTIGLFYGEIKQALIRAGSDLFARADPNRQVDEETGLADVHPVTDVESAIRAIDTIVEQGEGNPNLPVDDDGKFAHYYRFSMIYEGRELIPNPDAARDAPPEDRYIYRGNQVPFDETGLLRLPTNPKASDLAVGTFEREATDEFNAAYTRILQMLQRGFTGSPEAFGEAITAMKADLTPLALQLTSIQLPNGMRAGPTFEYLI